MSITTSLQKFLTLFQNLDQSPEQTESFNLYFELGNKLIESLAQSESDSQITGALKTYEAIFLSIIGRERYQRSFEQLQSQMNEYAKKLIVMFKADFQSLKQEEGATNTEHPTCQRVMVTMKVLTQWMSSHHIVIEYSFENENGAENWI